MGNHLKRQVGVADVSYDAGTIEIRAHPGKAFAINSLLRTLRDEIGVNPIRRIDASIRGRVALTESGKVLHVSGTGERLALQGTLAEAEGERVVKGSIELKTDGTLTFKVAAEQ